MNLTPEQERLREQWRVAWAAIRYVQVYKSAPEFYTRKPPPIDKYPSREDLQHSALFRRLLRGEEPLPEPPPIKHGYPNYAAPISGICPECGGRIYCSYTNIRDETDESDVYKCSEQDCGFKYPPEGEVE